MAPCPKTSCSIFPCIFYFFKFTGKLSIYLTISETAKLLNKSTKTLRRWDEEGKLSAVREPMSNYRVYRKEEVERMVNDGRDLKEFYLEILETKERHERYGF